MEYGTVLLTSFGMQLPIILVWLVGLVLAILRWKRHPRTSLLFLIALGVALLGTLLGIISSVMPLYLSQNLNLAYNQISIYMGVVNVIGTILHMVMWILLVIAVFMDRKTAA